MGGYDQPGELVFGGVDPAHYVGEFAFVPLTDPGYWSVKLDSVKLGDLMTLSAAGTAIVDAIASMLGAQVLQGFYVVSCEKQLPSLSFGLGGRDYVLDQFDWGKKRLGFARARQASDNLV